MLEQRIRGLGVGFVVVAACTSDPLRLQVAYFSRYGVFDSHDYITDLVIGDSHDYIIDLDANGRARFPVEISQLGGPEDSSTDGVYVRGLRAVYFFEKGSDTAYRGYVYLAFGCGVDLAICGGPDDDDPMIFHRALDGTTDNLFAESTVRPFYLEVDEENLDLGRLVVTSVPSVELAPSLLERQSADL